MIFFATEGIPEAQAGLMRHEIALTKMGLRRNAGIGWNDGQVD
jgi:hypothetical protein